MLALDYGSAYNAGIGLKADKNQQMRKNKSVRTEIEADKETAWHAATFFKLSEDRARIETDYARTLDEIMEEKATVLLQPGKSYYLNPDTGNQLLFDFAEVTNPDKLLEFLSQWGLPIAHTSGFEVLQLLKTAAGLQWLLLILDAISENPEHLGKWIEIVVSPQWQLLSLVPTPGDMEHALKFWDGVHTIDGEQISPFQFKASKQLRLDGEISLLIAKKGFAHYINRLLTSVSPRLDSDFQPSFKAKTPWEAMCLALFHQACDSSTIGRCRNCGRFFERSRKDRKYCNSDGKNSCQRSAHRNKVRFPQ